MVALIASVDPGLETFCGGATFNDLPIHAEVIAAKIRADRLLYDRIEEHGDDLMLVKMRPIVNISRRGEKCVGRIQIKNPPKQQISFDAFQQLFLAVNCIQCPQQQRLHQNFRTNTRSSKIRIDLIKQITHSEQNHIDAFPHIRQWMIAANSGFHIYRKKRPRLSFLTSTHLVFSESKSKKTL